MIRGQRPRASATIALTVDNYLSISLALQLYLASSIAGKGAVDLPLNLLCGLLVVLHSKRHRYTPDKYSATAATLRQRPANEEGKENITRTVIVGESTALLRYGKSGRQCFSYLAFFFMVSSLQ
jgi:hypothetical protein